ncbi:MAG: acetoin utilization protein AcuC [Planctomycetota bacterium]
MRHSRPVVPRCKNPCSQRGMTLQFGVCKWSVGNPSVLETEVAATCSARPRAVFMWDERFDRNAYPDVVPFRTDRAAMARRTLMSMGMLSPADEAPVCPATREQIERFHDGHYLDVMLAAERGDMGVEGLRMGFGTGDCPVFRGMYAHGALAAGATLGAAEWILSGEATVAFNPHGGFHHAGPDYAAGFCYINDVVLGLLALAEAGRRVLFLDIDVHHSDGVQDAFYQRDDVCVISMHETGRRLFPGTGFAHETGVQAGEGYSVNVPLPPGTYDDAYLRAYRAVAVPVIDHYDPDVIVVEVGMDGLVSDPLAELALTNNAHAAILADLLARRKPILATGGGGYHPENSARGWALAWGVLSGQDVDADAALGLGGVMLSSTDWQGGLRDRVHEPLPDQREAVDRHVAGVIHDVIERVFPRLGLAPRDSSGGKDALGA